MAPVEAALGRQRQGRQGLKPAGAAARHAMQHDIDLVIEICPGRPQDLLPADRRDLRRRIVAQLQHPLNGAGIARRSSPPGSAGASEGRSQLMPGA